MSFLTAATGSHGCRASRRAGLGRRPGRGRPSRRRDGPQRPRHGGSRKVEPWHLPGELPFERRALQAGEPLLGQSSGYLPRTHSVRAGGGRDSGIWRTALSGRAESPALSVEVLLINHLPAELYVRGVLPNEMLPFWPLEALKCQAIVTRSYALSVRRSSHFDCYAVIAPVPDAPKMPPMYSTPDHTSRPSLT
jgi:Stage II sporulation protein